MPERVFQQGKTMQDLEAERAKWEAEHGLKPGEYDKLTPAQRAELETGPVVPSTRPAESAALVAPILATGMNDYVAELPEPLAGPTLITFEKSNTRSATLLVGKNKKPIHTVVNGRMAELPPGTISPRNTYTLTETADAYVLDPDYDIVVEEEPVKFQVKYKDGGGEQVVGTSADAIREARLAFWGDREIVSVEEIKP